MSFLCPEIIKNQTFIAVFINVKKQKRLFYVFITKYAIRRYTRLMGWGGINNYVVDRINKIIIIIIIRLLRYIFLSYCQFTKVLYIYLFILIFKYIVSTFVGCKVPWLQVIPFLRNKLILFSQWDYLLCRQLKENGVRASLWNIICNLFLYNQKIF